DLGATRRASTRGIPRPRCHPRCTAPRPDVRQAARQGRRTPGRGGGLVMDRFTEEDLEEMAIEVLGELGWDPVPGTAIAPGAPGPDGEGERHTWDELLIRPRLRAALRRLNPDVPREYLDQALDAISS